MSLVEGIVGTPESIRSTVISNGSGDKPAVDAQILRAIKSVILLTGSVRQDRIYHGLNRSILDLPLDRDRSLAVDWAQQIAQLARRLNRGPDNPLPLRIALDEAAPKPTLETNIEGIHMEVVRDPRDLRGTGGILHDLADASYHEDDVLLVAQGAQWIVGSLSDHVARMAQLGGDVVLVDHEDGTPSGLMLVRCAALKSIPETGFVDMKEQGLSKIAKTHDVRIDHCLAPTGQPVRTLPDYLHALKMYHRMRAGLQMEGDPFEEELKPTFSVVEKGAEVDPTARVHDSVVLAGAKVEANAVIVRSLVGGNVRVRPEQRLIDRVLIGAPQPRRAPEVRS